MNIRKALFIVIAASFVLRCYLTFSLELTNDETNYHNYAMYPDLSHYEHPPMVGYFIQITTLNMFFDNEFLMRLSSLLLGALNSWLIFLVGKKAKDEITGFYSAMLYTSSIYCFVICGVFIHPDTPMVFFWLLSLYFLIDALLIDRDIRASGRSLLLAGLFIGLGMLSKYVAFYLWAAVFLYALLYQRELFKRKELYLSVLITVLCFLPVIIWNLQNQLQTAAFWDSENKLLKSGFNPDNFIQQIAGQFFYNNPVNFILIVTVLIAIVRRKQYLSNRSKFLLICGLPLVIFMLTMSFFGRILPHWAGGGYLSLIVLTSVWLADRPGLREKLFPVSVQIALIITLLTVIFGFAQINYGLIDLTGNKPFDKPEALGDKDVTLDMYGWRQAADKFREIDSRLVSEGKISANAPIFSDKWYNAGHLDFYVAQPMDKILFAAGQLSEIRKYYWINSAHGGYSNVEEAYYISVSRDYTSPAKYCSSIFSSITPADTIRIQRSGKIVENMFVYIMKK